MNELISKSPLKKDISTPTREPIQDFLKRLKEKMHQVFHLRGDVNQYAQQRGIPPFVLREIMDTNPLSIGIPTEYGGRGAVMRENLALLEAASYESLALSLTFGINSALFLQPVAKYASHEAKAPVFKRFIENKTMGGLMITEPDFGSDALNMQTSFTENEKHYQLSGKKHWAGLTGWADFWLLTARGKTEQGDLKRDIDFFICDVTQPGQSIRVEEFYDNLGLYQIPYGRNHIDVSIPKVQKLTPHTTGVKMMLDLLHRSRMQFPGMGMGFIQRMLDEGINHCKQRLVGGKSLFSYDQVQERLSKLQASFTVCSAMCANSAKNAGLDKDLTGIGIEANAVKSVITDLMQQAAQSVTQLVGAKAYRNSHIAGRGITDSRPFQIFEGSNDILYAQISEGLVKQMKKLKESNLFQFMKANPLTNRSADQLKELFNFKLDMQLPQRKLVELGQIMGRVISMDMVHKLADEGFRADLIEGGLEMLEQEIQQLMGTFHRKTQLLVVDNYQENSSWLKHSV
ncbi:acyl-CoA dehydrogenase family protein [Mangrovibacterium marinum]|uniref:Alkylation response protein AidB-like acyl-CoA dehydrogenase n=1 Tax=Mangrovibacterium marinum TaxID=1639118 RepID=A0A2T5C245_9BACT|nr:acyl-CoA dehydrogenase family protein [Mangrovibacterium marinum]PTN08758.1 alkylation response protein AidB-like acyl-CoA dehydrogenase [Mangrovibacterium marinum]